MRWWPWRRDCIRADRADDALSLADEQYEEAKALGAEVEQVTRQLRELREENHFASAIERALREGR